jgi:hypothetical protein
MSDPLLIFKAQLACFPFPREVEPNSANPRGIPPSRETFVKRYLSYTATK